MPINWDDYEAFDPGVDRPLHEVSRTEAQGYFERFMAHRSSRPPALRRLLAANGVELTSGDDAIDQLNRWYVDHVEGDPTSERLDSWWYVVARDIGIWVGEELIDGCPGLEWRLFTGGRTDVAYQRPVVMGFDVPNKKYNVDPERIVVGAGVRAIQGRRDAELLKRVVSQAVAKA